MDIIKLEGIRFCDASSSRERLLVEEGPYKGWLCYKHPDGQWVTLREATKDEIATIKDLLPPTPEQVHAYVVETLASIREKRPRPDERGLDPTDMPTESLKPPVESKPTPGNLGEIFKEELPEYLKGLPAETKIIADQPIKAGIPMDDGFVPDDNGVPF